jgi:hypothetical protein
MSADNSRVIAVAAFSRSRRNAASHNAFQHFQEDGIPFLSPSMCLLWAV